MKRYHPRIYIYIDYTDDGRPFYVGQGTIYRLRDLNRNDKHTHISKTFGQNRRRYCHVSDYETANAIEIHLIQELNTFYKTNPELGCNFTEGGGGIDGYEHTDDAKNKIGEYSKVWFSNPDNKKKQAQAISQAYQVNNSLRKQQSARIKKSWQNPDIRSRRIASFPRGEEHHTYGKEMDNSLREKISETTKAAMQKPEVRAKILAKAARVKGKPLSDMHKQNISQGARAFYKTSVGREVLKNRPANFTGKQHTGETKELISEKCREVWADPVRRKKQSQVRKEHFQDLGNRKKRSSQQKKLWEDPNYVENQRSKHKGKLHSAEAKEKIGQKSKSYYADPDKRQFARECAKRRWDKAKLMKQNPAATMVSKEYDHIDMIGKLMCTVYATHCIILKKECEMWKAFEKDVYCCLLLSSYQLTYFSLKDLSTDLAAT